MRYFQVVYYMCCCTNYIHTCTYIHTYIHTYHYVAFMSCLLLGGDGGSSESRGPVPASLFRASAGPHLHRSGESHRTLLQVPRV